MNFRTQLALDELSERVDDLGRTLRQEMTSMQDELRHEFREGLAENRRHAEVLYESLRDDIRLVADGLATVMAKLDNRI